MAEAQVITKVERSPKGLVEALFNSLDGLNAGVKDVDDVRAVCHTARAIVTVARLEMDAARLADAIGKRVEFKSLPDLGQRPRAEAKPSDEKK